MDFIKYSIVIPVYNSSSSLIELVERTNRVFSEQIKENYEIILVDDASPNPETGKILSDLKKKHSFLTIITLTRNFGQHPATLCGIENAKGEYIITMDDDLQHSPEDILILLKEQSHDIVMGKFNVKNHGFLKRVSSSIKSKVDNFILQKPKNVLFTSFRLINKNIAEEILKIQTPAPYIPSLLAYVSKDIVNVEVSHQKRVSGQSGYGLYKSFKLFTNLLFSNSSALLKLITLTGILFSLVSFATMVYFLWKKLVLGIPVQGWTSLIVITLGIGGLILFSIGILGEYFIRIISGIEKRPNYIVRSKE